MQPIPIRAPQFRQSYAEGPQEIKSKLGIKGVRGDSFGYLQRSFIGCVSDVESARSA